MPLDTVIALAIVGGALGYLLRRALRKSRARKAGGPDCNSCGH